MKYYNLRVGCAAGGRRFSEGTSADREIQRTLMEVSV